tara:strand:+ start:33 stop:179 length:147 start_codon:yes stop_codon:yes gene_type:complete
VAKIFRVINIRDKRKSPKKTSVGNKNVKTSSMNKSRKRSFKKYRGQGK